MKIILQKYISDSGLCSRRRAEDLIRNGKVMVNNQKAELGMKVDEQDKVKIDNKIIKPVKEKIYIKLNKPIGFTCTSRKFKGEKNIFELLSKLPLRAERSNFVKSNLNGITSSPKLLIMINSLFIVGRLDKNSRGLVILTNDGDWAQKIEHPRFGIEKWYEVKAENKKHKVESSKIITGFKKGIDIGQDDGVVKAKDIIYLGENNFRIILTQGKKRQIRRMFKALGLDVCDLLRIKIGDIELGDLGEGKWEVFHID
jgi:pseudouridine synthase